MSHKGVDGRGRYDNEAGNSLRRQETNQWGGRRLQARGPYFRACEDLHTVQEFQILPSLLLIGFKKKLARGKL